MLATSFFQAKGKQQNCYTVGNCYCSKQYDGDVATDAVNAVYFCGHHVMYFQRQSCWLLQARPTPSLTLIIPTANVETLQISLIPMPKGIWPMATHTINHPVSGRKCRLTLLKQAISAFLSPKVMCWDQTRNE
mmetsp:Transcript_7479/g.21820  ORF Transcript_7479/g.21820 Transcript_7479/m.21820 type:complete len:133 (-) Transcript_7479:87-485(-)